MSIIITRTLACDADDCEQAIVGYEEDTAAKLRETGRSEGWTYRKGVDRCERHTAET